MALPRLNVTTAEHDGATLVGVEGEIDLSTAPQLERELTTAAGAGGDIIVDLRDVEFMDSTGIGVLVRTSKKMESGQGNMTLVCSAGPVRRVIEVSGLDGVINVVDDLDNLASA